MGTFSSSLLNMDNATDWTSAALLNELLDARRKRHKALYGSYAGSHALISAGTDVQQASWIRELQTWVENNYGEFCRGKQFSGGAIHKPTGDPDNALTKYEDLSVSQFAADAGLNESGTPSDWWRRNASSGSYGPMTAGDYIGPWVWQDLANAYSTMKFVRDSNVVNIVNVPLTWCRYHTFQGVSFQDRIDAYRSNTDTYYMSRGYSYWYNPPSYQRDYAKSEGAWHFVAMGQAFYSQFGNPGVPEDMDIEGTVWNYSLITIWNKENNTAKIQGTSDEGYAAFIKMCYKAVQHTNAIHWDGTITRKMYIKAEIGNIFGTQNSAGRWVNDNPYANASIPNQLGAAYKQHDGSADFYRRPPASRGGGNSPITSLQNGWNAIYSQGVNGNSTVTKTRNIVDSITDVDFDKWHGSSNLNTLSLGSWARMGMRGWHSNTAEAYVVLPDF